MTLRAPLTPRGLLDDIEHLVRTYDEFSHCVMRSHDRMLADLKDGSRVTVLVMITKPKQLASAVGELPPQKTEG
jgi:hypothetical protein